MKKSMKKSTLIIFILLAFLKIQAQNYLISFAGSGAASTVETIEVRNLTSGASVSLNGGDILHLSGLVGISDLKRDNGEIQIYPNPAVKQATLLFDATENGSVDIVVVDLAGKTICKDNRMLSTGSHSFHISGISQGMYIVKVTGNGYWYTAKLLSQSNSKSKAAIEYISSSPEPSANSLKSTSATIEMIYKTGDRLLYKGVSGIYSTVVPDVPAGNKTVTFTFVACTDKDNNNYSVVKVNNQIWMAENLKTTRYNDGTQIPLVRDNAAWGGLTSPGYCWYNNDSIDYKGFSGAMYNWYAANTSKLAPAGWHIPSDAEWTTLTTNVGGLATAGGILKETGNAHWSIPNTDATDEYGFSALAGGERFNGTGDFVSIGTYGFWWSSTAHTTVTTTAWYRYITYNAANVNRFNGSKSIGMSIRCVKD